MDNFDENKEPIAQTGENQTPYEEEKKVDVKEALTFMFKDGNASKFWGGGILYAVLATIAFLIYKNPVMDLNIVKFSGLMVFFTICTIVNLIVCGNIVLFQHDRALDKSSVLRDYSGNLLDALFSSIKNGAAVTVYGIILYAILAFLGLVTAILTKLNVILGIIVGLIYIVLIISALICIIILFLTICPYYSKDLKFVSWFKWKEAFTFCKDVHYGAKTIWTYIGLYIIPIMVFAGFITFTKQPIVCAVSVFLMYLYTFYMVVFMSNVFGQFSYNAIEKNMHVKPETLPKEINKDKGGIIASIVIYLLICFGGMIAALVIPSLINRQADLASTIKIKKAVASYYDLAGVYMAENKTKNLQGMFGYNCENASEYFKIVEQNGCNFETPDGVYWQFNQDGSATISDSSYNPIRSIKVGVCKDGQINCPEEYPDVENLLYNK